MEKKYDASLDAEMEERSSTSIERDNKRIKSYKFTIAVHNELDLVGELSREEMNLIYQLYSSEGANLTQRQVCRYFPQYTLRSFKRILRAFNITKASSPFAPHMLEERTTEELIELTWKSKEDSYLKKFEQERSRLAEDKLKEVIKENYELKNQAADFKDFAEGLNVTINTPDFSKQSPIVGNNNTIIVYLSDMHIGAEVSSYSMYDNVFNFAAIQKRMNKIINKIVELQQLTKATNIIICNLGDSLDGYNGETTRGGHKLPQNMNNKEQFTNYLTIMLELFSAVVNSGLFLKVNYYCVEGGNHDGDFGFISNKALEASLNKIFPEVTTKIFDKFIDSFKVGKNTFLLCHGKDSGDMFTGLPLVLDPKTENKINEFIDYKGYTGKIHFIKGDLHRPATTFGSKIRYKSVGSFFGSSEYIQKNFGNTKPCVDFDVLINNDLMEYNLCLL